MKRYLCRRSHPQTNVRRNIRVGRPHSDVPVLGRLGQCPARGGSGRLGHTPQSVALLRQRAHPIRGLGEGRPGSFAHASAKTTLDVYGHLFPDEGDRTRAAMDAEL
jgi:hypothetical protein